jgi:glutamate 5-kinase
MKIVVKIGTQSILADDGTPLESVMLDLVEQIVALKNNGHQVILVSSGAVASGRKILRGTLQQEYGDSIGEKQILASLGQPELMHIYSVMFRKHNILSSQLLLTKQDLHTRQHYLNISRLLSEILSNDNIIPIINENDSVAIEELMFTDNDELSGLIAAQIGADKLIIISNVEGVYTSHPDDPNAILISVIGHNGWPKVSSTKSTQGRGGMLSKVSTARKMSSLGITTHIVGIGQPNVLLSVLKDVTVGTTILPSRKKSNIKRWIACNVCQINGTIHINECLYNLLKENSCALSILPVGICKYTGLFKKGDVVDIMAPDGKKIGMGIARYDSSKLKRFCGEKNKPVFIHYDHLHLF